MGVICFRPHVIAHAESYQLITRWAPTTYSPGSKRCVGRAPNKFGVSLDMEAPRTTNCRASDGIASTTGGRLGAMTAASVITARPLSRDVPLFDACHTTAVANAFLGDGAPYMQHWYSQLTCSLCKFCPGVVFPPLKRIRKFSNIISTD